MEETTALLSEELSESLSGLTDIPTNTEEAGEYLQNLIMLIQEFAVTYGVKLVVATALLIIGFKLINVFAKKLSKSKTMSKVELSTQGFVNNIFSIGLKIVLAITALGIIGVPMTSIIAVVGSCGLAIGLALQGSLSNIAGGFIILFLKPFVVGDFITSGDIAGTVESIGIFHTRVITGDNKRIVVPNSTISNATLTNASALKERRVDLTFTASYSNDVDLVENVLKEVCGKHELIFTDPEPFVHLSAHKDFALEYTVRVWCKSEDYWTVYFDLLKNVKSAFDENSISIPYPRIDIKNK